ncbi:MAG: AAA family ATPase [Methylococcales bacterium]
MKEKLLEGRGILCLTGETGVGKSFLLHEITIDLANEVTFIYMSSEGQDFQGLITGLCEDLGLATGKEIILVALQSIKKFLEKKRQIYPRIALIIDDAHQLQASVLDKLLLLSVAPSDASSSFQLIMSGLPELEDKVYQGKRPRNEQSRFFCYKLERLEALEVGDFIKHHLNTRDYGNIELFTPAAISRIAECSNGTPRIIKKISDSALFAIGAPESPRVTEKLIEYVTQDLFAISKGTTDKTTVDNFDQRITLKSKAIGIDGTKDTLSLAQSDVYDKIDRTEDQQPIKRAALSQMETGLNNLPDLPLSETGLKDYVESEEDRFHQTMNFKTLQRLIWGLTGLALLGVAIFIYRSNISPNDENLPIASQAGLTDTALDKELPRIGKLEQESEQTPSRRVNASKKQFGSPKQAGKPNQPGSAARAYIADLEESGHSVDLDIVFNHAELLKRQNQPADNYLLNFYAAKRGHANAAFRLAQMFDPETVTQGSKAMFNKPNITQANKWYSQAALAGHLNAAIYLKKLQARIILKAATGDENALRQMMQFQNKKVVLPSS